MKILCLDFDGVLHSYASGWRGPRNIPDAPVAGALEFLVSAQKRFEVHVFSSRSRYWFGRTAMRRWLIRHLTALAPNYEACPLWLWAEISTTCFADPWEDEVRWATKRIVGALRFPTEKPPAHVTLDDRALTFNGTWPDLDSIEDFTPWNRKL